jgi:hypothetical protein
VIYISSPFHNTRFDIKEEKRLEALERSVRICIEGAFLMVHLPENFARTSRTCLGWYWRGVLDLEIAKASWAFGYFFTYRYTQGHHGLLYRSPMWL